MIFSAVPVEQAEGLTLAHSQTLPGRRLRKGTVLSAEDVQALRLAGISSVTGVRFDETDLPEDEAAAAIAQAVAGPGTTLGPATTGRVNLFAEHRGLLMIDTAAVDAINLKDEGVTLATLPAFSVVQPRQMIATAKIIRFAADRSIIEDCTALARDAGPVLRVLPFRALKAGLILTRTPGMKDSILSGTIAVTAARLEALDSHLVFEHVCTHDESAIALGISAALAEGCDLILISGASATGDRADVVPSAITAAGGSIDHFGMPVDPGNLLLLGRLGAVPVVNLPGCGRSPKLNGLDWVLRRIAAGVEITSEDIMRMGVGGLLMEILDRPSPRQKEEAKAAPRIAGLVLAAGRSSRMGRNKLMMEVRGKPMVAHALDAALGSNLSPVVMVAGHSLAEVSRILPPGVALVRNPSPDLGLSSSLITGLQALPEDVDGVLILLGDMPLVAPRHVRRLIEAFDPTEGRAICVPVWHGRRGNPVLLARRFFPELLGLTGDSGARRLIADYPEAVYEVEMDDNAILTDVDTVEDLVGV
ncbi:NTP transferase domain-containing protein [Telmatospirillum sp. J64-1]|uniref:NTP transferase domain-containing protein n=1 Tax=Telmatospirillum sp. J64-1 TaxID=2502183 RepID=UPI00115EFE8C|nr:molybdopterin-binding/glycosyltransferase family 2 protein [Telmatospirillum sp. J64-1]